MKSKLLLSLCACVLSVGIGYRVGAAGAERPTSERSVETSGPISVYRDKAAFDADGRHFVLWGNPSMVTQFHRQLVEEFIRRPGAGISRMEPRVAPQDWVELVPESLGDVHNTTVDGKAHPPRYDAVNETLTLPDGTQRMVRERVWRLREQRLMSVNAETGPAVYVQDAKAEHDRMKEKKAATSKNTPTRKLDEFETAALAHLREGNDVVMQSSAQEMRAVGAIRAREQCMECHKGQVGDILGAFSYKLQMQSDATPAADRLKDTAGLSPSDLEAVHFVEALGGKVIRTPGGPISELYLAYPQNQVEESKVHVKRPVSFSHRRSTHVPVKNSALRILESFPELHVLDMSNSMVTDVGLKDVAKLKKLRKLYYTPGYLTDAGIAELKKALPECDIVKTSPVLGPVAP